MSTVSILASKKNYFQMGDRWEYAWFIELGEVVFLPQIIGAFWFK